LKHFKIQFEIRDIYSQILTIFYTSKGKSKSFYIFLYRMKQSIKNYFPPVFSP